MIAAAEPRVNSKEGKEVIPTRLLSKVKPNLFPLVIRPSMAFVPSSLSETGMTSARVFPRLFAF